MVVIITFIIMKRNYGDGNTVEEYCIPFISWSFYEIIKYWKERKNNSEHCIIAGGLYGVTLNLFDDQNYKFYTDLCRILLYLYIWSTRENIQILKITLYLV